MLASEILINERIDNACLEYLSLSKTLVEELEDYLAASRKTMSSDDVERLALLTDAYAERIFKAECHFTTTVMIELAMEIGDNLPAKIAKVGEASRLITYWSGLRLKRLDVQQRFVPTPHLDRLIRVAENMGRLVSDQVLLANAGEGFPPMASVYRN